MKRWILTALLMWVAQDAAAHEFWIEPSTFRPGTGETVYLQLRVGQNFLGDPIPRDPESIVRFFAVDGDGIHAVPGFTGRAPAGIFVARNRGPVVFAYESRGAITKLTKEKFRKHLMEQGLDPALSGSARRGGLNKEVSERFIRCAKSVLDVSGSSPADRIVGMPLELIAESLPRGSRQSVALRLLSDDRPYGGALVTVISRRDPSKRASARTDRKGRVLLHLDGDGPWLASSVRMIEGSKADGVDWTSYWVSLTFN